MTEPPTKEGARSIWKWLCAVLADGADLDLPGVIEKLKARRPTNEQARRAHEALITALFWGLEAGRFAAPGSLADSGTTLMRDGTVDKVLASSLEFVDVARQERFPGVARFSNPPVEMLWDFLADPRWVEDEKVLAELETLIRRYRKRQRKASDPAG